MIDSLLAQHDLLRGLIDELEAQVSAEKCPADLNLLADCRWRLASLLMRHLAAEDRALYIPLEHDDRPGVVDLARRSKADLEAGFADLTEHLPLSC